ncbi:MAG: hypothetical protein HQK66_09355 [Desulfamplus sp.]|nr:hypothetical protein [Desulfamplus sp.]
MTFFNGFYTDRKFFQAVFNLPGDMEKKYMHSLNISRRIMPLWSHFTLEAEGILALHHGRHKYGTQQYIEGVMALLLRYEKFPWNHIIPTSMAIAEGLSLTSSLSEREVQSRDKSRRFLNYLGVEFAITHPGYPDYSLVYRIHHRSGIFGLFDGIEGASDFYLLGIRYRF